jgi:LysM repeat protein
MSNPFSESGQVSEERERRRHERVKVGVYAILGTSLVFLVGLLIQGCQRDQAKTETGAETPSDTNNATASAPAVAGQQPDTNATPLTTAASVPASPTTEPATNVVATPPPAVANEVPAATVPAPAGSTYVIKPGDTLERIAKAHGTSVKALKAANHLKSDRIVAGRKLKLPQATPSAG